PSTPHDGMIIMLEHFEQPDRRTSVHGVAAQADHPAPDQAFVQPRLVVSEAPPRALQPEGIAGDPGPRVAALERALLALPPTCEGAIGVQAAAVEIPVPIIDALDLAAPGARVEVGHRGPTQPRRVRDVPST